MLAVVIVAAGCAPAPTTSSVASAHPLSSRFRLDRALPRRRLLLSRLAHAREMESARRLSRAHAAARLLSRGRPRRHGLAHPVGRRAWRELLHVRLVLGPRSAPARARARGRVPPLAVQGVDEVLPPVGEPQSGGIVVGGGPP